MERIRGREHWTTKPTPDGDVRLFLWEKAVPAGTAKRGTILFVHGSSMASTPTFDLDVPGRPDSSVMDYFASRGFDAWCVDMEGYGRSAKHRDIPCDIANGAEDCAAAASYIARERRSGPLFETYLLRALRVGQGDITVLFSSTIGNVLWIMVAASLLLPWLRDRRRQGVLAQTARAGHES